MQNFMFGGVTVLAVQLFNKIKWKKKRNLKKHVSLYYPHVLKTTFSVNFLGDILDSRNGNHLKLKVKSKYSLSMGVLINHSNAYIHSITLPCDNV